MSICRNVTHIRFLFYFNFRLWHINFDVSFHSHYAFILAKEWIETKMMTATIWFEIVPGNYKTLRSRSEVEEKMKKTTQKLGAIKHKKSPLNIQVNFLQVIVLKKYLIQSLLLHITAIHTMDGFNKNFLTTYFVCNW